MYVSIFHQYIKILSKTPNLFTTSNTLFQPALDITIHIGNVSSRFSSNSEASLQNYQKIGKKCFVVNQVEVVVHEGRLPGEILKSASEGPLRSTGQRQIVDPLHESGTIWWRRGLVHNSFVPRRHFFCLGTTCVVISITGYNLQSPVNMLPITIELRKKT